MFVGPSYSLDNYKASAQRSVNLTLRPVEVGTERARFTLDSVPGVVSRQTLGADIRGAHVAEGRLFVVAGATLFEIASDWTATNRGTLSTSAGEVSMTHGLSQLVMADGVYLYVFTLAGGVFSVVTDGDASGFDTVGFIENYFTLTGPGQAFYITAINDATSVDALDFAAAEAAPDGIVSHLSVGSELYLFGSSTIEVWFYSGNPDFPFERNRGAFIEHGLYAKHSLVKIDGGAMFVGADDTGPASVYLLRGYQLQRVSTRAVEEALNDADLSTARAYTYTRKGSKVYCLKADGLATTWCYDLLTQSWFEWADQDIDGQFEPFRVTHAASCFDENVQFGDQKVYTLSDTTYTFDGDEIVRERSGPHDIKGMLDRKTSPEFVADVLTGGAALGVSPVIGLSWSDDGGATWGNELQRSIGLTGERFTRVVWRRLGQSRDRVWRLRSTCNAPFSIIQAGAR